MARGAAAGTAIGAVPRVVLVDANVFFAPRLRDLFMFLHAAELVHVHWTREIEREWARNVVETHGVDPQVIDNCLRGMRLAAPGWEVAGYERYQQAFQGVHEKDRHVAAAAFKLTRAEWPGQPVALVTKNVKDFPAEAFARTQVARMDMADYLDALYAEAPEAVLRVVNACREKLKNPRYTRQDYVEALVRHGCTRLASAAARDWGLVPGKAAAGRR